MIYNIIWSSRNFGGAEIYVRKMKNEFGFEFISLQGLSVSGWANLLLLLINSNNTFIFHDQRASLLSFFRFFYRKDYFVIHGPGKNNSSLRKYFYILSFFSKRIILVSNNIYPSLPNNKYLILENVSELDTLCDFKSYDFIYFGRIESAKNVDKLCELWSTLDLQQKLHIVGDGDLLDKLKFTYKNSNINFYGALSHLDIIGVVQKSGFYISLSQREGVSLSLLEAISTGLISLVVDIPSQKFIHQDYKLNLIASDLHDVNSLVQHYLDLDNIKKENLHKNVITTFEENKSDSWYAFWSKI